MNTADMDNNLASLLGNSTTAPSSKVPIIWGLWVILVFVAIFMGAMYFFAFKRGWFRWEHVTERSMVGAVHKSPMVLFVTRVVSFVFCLSIFIAIFANSTEGQGLQFYTIWNFVMLIVYFGCVSLKSFFAYRNGFSKLDDTPTPTFFNKSIVVMFHICATMVFLVDIVLWTVLYPAAKSQHHKHPHDPDYACCEKFTNFFSVVVHGLNFFFMYTEVFQNRMRFVAIGFLWVMTWMFSYGIFQWIYASAPAGHWVYFFLDTTALVAPGWYTGMFLLHVVFFFIAYGVGKLKEKKFALTGDSSAESAYLFSNNQSVA